MTDVQAIVDQATRDPEFAVRLSQDPFHAAWAIGFDGSPGDLAAGLGVPGAKPQEIAEALRARTAAAPALLMRAGGGGYPEPRD
jgi:hypothetical protein